MVHFAVIEWDFGDGFIHSVAATPGEALKVMADHMTNYFEVCSGNLRGLKLELISISGNVKALVELDPSDITKFVSLVRIYKGIRHFDVNSEGYEILEDQVDKSTVVS